MAFYYKLTIAYDGTDFHGSQRQIDNDTMDSRRNDAKALTQKRRRSDNTTVQEIIEAALLHLFPDIPSVSELQLRFAGRTDKGVHAIGQVALICLQTQEEAWELRRSLNSRLPSAVSIECVESSEVFDPRKDCVRKVYEYSIRFRVHNPNLPEKFLNAPHLIRSACDNENRLWLCPWALDQNRLAECCLELQGTHDYSNFVHKAERDSGRDHTLTIEDIRFLIDNEKTEEAKVGDITFRSTVTTGRFRLTATSFRRSMVRLIVGYCVDCSRVPAAWTKAAFAPNESCNRMAPACGLCLESVSF